MGQIQELDIQLANKIAAGEVVERPASVVKELVENAIDAGADTITVKVREAGLQSIAVSDNGSGIQEEDIPLAFGRHATSKIHTNHDLFHIRTLGFRGEALASITSVSRVTLKTCADNTVGHMVKVENSEIIEESLTRAKKGTEIIVEDLFYNTPARLKYVKSLHTELGKITDIMNRFAMSHSHIRFTLQSEDKTVLQTSGNGKLNEVMAQVYGLTIARDLVAISGETGDYKVTGRVARPEHTRANRHYMSLFINGRYIKNFMLTKAIIAGYHTLLPIGRYPVVAIDITMDPGLVDVNVHPTKQEVRLSKEPELMTLITNLIKEALLGESLIPEMTVPKQNKVLEKFEQQRFIYEQTRPVEVTEIKEEAVIEEPAVSHEQLAVNHEPADEDREEIKESAIVTFNEEQSISEQPEQPVKERRLPYMEVVGQVHGTYIIAQNDEGMFMIDQHAAQERIKYEYFRERMGEVEHHVQSLLVPITLNFTKDEALRIEKHRDDLAEVGLELESFGGSDYIVQAVPTWFPGDAEETIKDIVEYCLQHQKVDLNKFREDTAIMMSCKKSIKANHYLRKEDMSRLLEELAHTSEPFTCPHGRPITIKYTTYELEKMFKRVM
ncbi:DNA mismatch repair endonuclease MutL [Macrococcus hajekii]|uniref:DNA mismatch repair protein MutL n=1 Tax=Macrococcus hajekii TaxID=198482 RepID=A0A4R6BMR4_9STAP|nr:DNA mismatch repair endonuclease MutL [Macrococcus hajekii]TDM03120.1 DNA mismatch repair endonuclease MutL [Macrococcus hajekii]GGA96138.1 DNA mismatch repair protein MutL [Macrococcus hajekii]